MLAAIIYQHATSEADARIAASLEAALAGDDGTRPTTMAPAKRRD